MISRRASCVSQERSRGKPKIKTKLVKPAGPTTSSPSPSHCWCCLKPNGDTQTTFLGKLEAKERHSCDKIEISVTGVAEPLRATGSGSGGGGGRERCRQSGLLCNVDQVKRNFIGLLRYNKLQDFYLGTLVYSVIIATIIFHSTLVMPPSDRNELGQFEYRRKWPAERANWTRLQAGGCPARASFANEPLNLQLSLLLLGSMLLLIILLTLLGLAAFSSYRNKLEPASDEQLPARAETTSDKTQQLSKCGSLATIDESAARDNWAREPAAAGSAGLFAPERLQLMALVTILLALHLPSALFSVAGLRSSLYAAQAPPDARCQFVNGTRPEVAGRAPLAGYLALAYLQPLLLEGSSLNVKLVCALTIVPMFLLCWLELLSKSSPTRLLAGFIFEGQLAEHQRDLLLLFSVCLLPTVLLFGFRKRAKFSRSLTEATFEGASRLIEAKVSLEHQRQQQETLLLSVLPAYVADQVKRNMLKKMNTSEPQPIITTTTTVYQPETVEASAQSGSAPGQASSHLQEAGESRQQRQASHLLAGGSRAGNNNGSRHVTPSASGALSNQAISITQQASPSNSTQPSRRGFNELYIRTYNNVSLLYGDIVGFTRLCTQLSSSQLVRVLNELFSLFDHLAEKHKIMRIKILGDCYYGVGGIPEFAVMGAKSRNVTRNDNHAINCVNMGLDMIHYIRCLNVERTSSSSASTPLGAPPGSQQQQASAASGRPGGSALNLAPADTSGAAEQALAPGSPLPAFELNMRIGIHTGHIHSGVIGLKKWQFDVWSNDVSVAMHCESSGTAGRVQVTEATIQQLNGAFSYEQAQSSQRDTFFAEREIKTFLICDRISQKPPPGSAQTQKEPAELFAANSSARKRQLAANRKRQQQQQSARRPMNSLSLDTVETVQQAMSAPSNLDEDKIRAATIGTIRQTLLPGSEETASLDDSSSSSGPPPPPASYGLAGNHPDMKPLSLDFRDPAIGKLYAHCPIESLLQELLLAFFVLVVLFSLLDYFYFYPPTNQSVAKNKRLIAGMAILVSLFLASILLIRQSSSKKSVHRSVSEHAKRTRLFSADEHFRRDSGSYSIHVITDKSFAAKQGPAAWIWGQLVKVGRQFRKLLRKFARSLTRNNNSRTRLKTLLASCAYLTVILIQMYLVYSKFICPAGREKLDNKVIAIEQYQLTVILLLVSIDSSSNLLSYKAKCGLIVVLIVLQFLFTFRTTTTTALENATHLSLFCSENKTTPTTTTTTGNGAQTPNWPTNQQVADWFSAALLLVSCLWSLSFARQMDYTNKVNFLWRNKLSVDHEELEYISGVNKVLLENILPSHVVQYYLNHPNEQPKTASTTLKQPFSSSPSSPNTNPMRMSFSNIRNLNCNNELYHEQHDNVAVMFASIPHFYEFYDESNISKQGLGCIALLNEIICDFDKLLLKNKFSRIEKIKTIGSTYMAAAGLRPCHLTGSRNSTASQHNVAPPAKDAGQLAVGTSGARARQLQQTKLNAASSLQINMLLGEPPDDRKLVMGQQKLNLICMIQFASSLMNALNAINKQSFQVFKLRVGVNTGPVIAGVIGAQRPFYDIWGDCVNIASRMESLGEIGRIQVEEKTARLLMESLCSESYSFVCRGPIDVKGKGGMVTYFVDKKPAGGEPQMQAAKPPTGEQTANDQKDTESSANQPPVAASAQAPAAV